MGRPDLTEIRTAQILDAFERCVIQHGLHGSSLERVAEEAGMKRSVIRHYLGNRDALVEKLAERTVRTASEYSRAFVASVDPKRRMEQLLAFLFPSKAVTSTDSLLVIESLIAVGESQPRVRDLMTEYVADFVKTVSDQLRLAHPQATTQRAWSVAYGLVSICYNHASLNPLGLAPKFGRAAKTSAQALIDSLQDEAADTVP